MPVDRRAMSNQMVYSAHTARIASGSFDLRSSPRFDNRSRLQAAFSYWAEQPSDNLVHDLLTLVQGLRTANQIATMVIGTRSLNPGLHSVAEHLLPADMWRT